MDRPRPWWKKLLFGLITAVLFFLALEGILTLWGVSPQVVPRDPFVDFAPGIPLFEEREEDPGQVVLTTHPQKLTYFNSQTFLKQKLPNTYRIFCLGGSTTYGRPYDDSTSFPGWLRELLPLAGHSKNWEVINAGGISYASYRVATVMQELTRHQPDLFVVYCGHNEFLEERTYREINRRPKLLLETQALFSRTRTYATLKRMLRPLRPRSTGLQKLPGEVDAALDHMIGPELYHRDDTLRSQIIDHYAFNLARMVTMAHSAGAEILFVTPAANLKDASPFKSQHDQNLSREESRQWHQLYDEAIEMEHAGKYLKALNVFQKAAEIDSRYAKLHYRMGKILLGLKQFDEAKTAFQRARDEDVCPLRSLTEMSDIFGHLEKRDDVSVVDFEALIEEECFRKLGHRIPGKEFFFDHVHSRIPVNRLLATAIINRMIETEIVSPSAAWNEEEIRVVAERIESRIDRNAHAVALRNLAKVLTWAGKHDEAGPSALEALQTIPDDRECLFMAGTYLRRQGKASASFDHFSRAINSSDDAPDVHLGLAKIAVSEKRFPQARLHYEEVLRLQPGDPDALQGLASIGDR